MCINFKWKWHKQFVTRFISYIFKVSIWISIFSSSEFDCIASTNDTCWTFGFSMNLTRSIYFTPRYLLLHSTWIIYWMISISIFVWENIHNFWTILWWPMIDKYWQWLLLYLLIHDFFPLLKWMRCNTLTTFVCLNWIWTWTDLMFSIQFYYHFKTIWLVLFFSFR